MIKIKKIKHSKVILIFVSIFLLVLFIGNLSKTSEVKCEEFKSKIAIVDINEKSKKSNAILLDHLLEGNVLPKDVEFTITEMKKLAKGKTLFECYNQISNETLICWILENHYSWGYQINCVVGDWIILVKE